VTGSSAAAVGLSGVDVSVDDLIGLRFRAQRLELGIARRARQSMTGAHDSRFRGRGMEFAESRIYQPGDDVRSIDWRVTARTGRTHTKLFQEERERPVILLVDLGASMFFGTRTAYKSVLAAETAALIAWAAMQGGDRVGALLAGRSAHMELKPVPGRRGVLRVLRALATLSRPAADDEEQQIRLTDSLLRARHVARPGSLLVLISDFYSLDQEAAGHLTRMRPHNDMLACWIHDALEREPPPPGRYGVSDGWQTATLDTLGKRARARYRENFAEQFQRLRATLGRLAIPMLSIATGDDVANTIRRGASAEALDAARRGHKRGQI
jgi:uncharacterized protein (DUF58 family)